MSHWSRSFTTITLVLAWTIGCASEGSFSGDLAETQPPSSTAETPATKAPTTNTPTAPPPKHERVPFTWESTGVGHSGSIQTTLPDGQAFNGQFHQITATTTVPDIDGFYSSWYADGWGRPDWAWDGGWPYYDAPDEYIKYYTGRAVAVLTSEGGTSMRCNFQLDDPERGMKGGGQGDCQLSNGERITAVFAAT
jgi:hypothetical protein